MDTDRLPPPPPPRRFFRLEWESLETESPLGRFLDDFFLVCLVCFFPLECLRERGTVDVSRFHAKHGLPSSHSHIIDPSALRGQLSQQGGGPESVLIEGEGDLFLVTRPTSHTSDLPISTTSGPVSDRISTSSSSRRGEDADKISISSSLRSPLLREEDGRESPFFPPLPLPPAGKDMEPAVNARRMIREIAILILQCERLDED